MFLQTLRRLTILNSLVFLFIFIAFTSVLYWYLSYRLFDKVDDAMRAQAGFFRLANGRTSMQGRPPFDPRTFLMLRSEDGRVVSPNPFRQAEEISNVREVAAIVEPGEILTTEYDNHFYRLLCIPYRFEEKRLHSDASFQIKDVVVVSIVDSEVGLLSHLLLIIVGGLVVGTAGIIMAGYFLAKRAMIPIQAAWEKQQQFVADASHELRSPIAGIYSNAELILRHPTHMVEEESHRINTIMQESARMSKLIASLLTLARSDANKAELKLALVNISEVVEAIADYFQSLEELTHIGFSFQVDPNIELFADQERIHQLLVILIDNALQYTPSGGQVSLSCTRAEKHVVITVQDTGMGIAIEHLPHVFDRFFRGDKARSRNSGGSGLGLSIAKWIVEKHGGRISVESLLGKGTNFTVTLPVSKKI